MQSLGAFENRSFWPLARHGGCCFVIFSPTPFVVFKGLTNRKQFVVTGKRCRRDVPTGLKEFPFQSVVVECQLCGEQRRYLPTEVFLGKPDHLVAHQNRIGAN
jgi:hypothetical protein